MKELAAAAPTGAKPYPVGFLMAALHMGSIPSGNCEKQAADREDKKALQKKVTATSIHYTDLKHSIVSASYRE